MSGTLAGRRADLLPNYTRREEIFNMITHIVGGGLGLVALFACIIVAAYARNPIGVVSGGIYGLGVVALFSMSSVYHGLRVGTSKRVFRVLDHCTIYLLIACTYTPVLLGGFRVAYPVDAWVIFGVVWGLAATGITLTAINRKKFAIFGLLCYLGMGWMAMLRIGRFVEILGAAFFIMIIVGGVLYTVGVLFYLLGRRVKYMHSVFHIFVIGASVTHSVAIALFIMPL